MRIFVVETENDQKPAAVFGRLAGQGGMKTAVAQQGPRPVPWSLAMEHCPVPPEEIWGYTRFKERLLPPEQLPVGAGYAPDGNWDWEALAWFANWRTFFEQQVMEEGLHHVIVWHGGYVGPRAAIIAAEDLKLPVSVMEDGWFPAMGGTSTFTLSPGRAYFERPLAEWGTVPETWEYSEERITRYLVWWRQNKITKYSLVSKGKTMVPALDSITWPDSWSQVVYFDQLVFDAAMYWRCDPARREQAIEDAIAAGAWYKGSPFAARDYELEARFTGVIPPELNIHDVLPQTKVAVCMTSNVGLEALPYGVKVACYGEPFYKPSGLVFDSVAAAQAGEVSPVDDVLRYLDWLIHGVQFAAHDAKGFARLIREQAPYPTDVLS